MQPTSFLQLHTDDMSDPQCKIKIRHGTTTLAFRFKGGIIVAVDSRATQGSYVGQSRLPSACMSHLRLLLAVKAGTGEAGSRPALGADS